MHLDKKYLFLGTSLFFKLLINVFVVFYIAKMVNVNEFGSFSLAFIISSIATLCLDYGFNLKGLILTSKTREEVNEELSSMIFSKLILTGLFGVFFAVFFLLNTYESSTKIVILILVLSAVPLSFGNFYLNNFKIINRFEKEALGYIIQGSSLLLYLVINHFFGSNSILSYAIGILISRFLYLIYGFFAFRKAFFKSINYDFSKAIKSIRTATPFGVHLILGASIIYIDTFILSFLSSLENVGLYQAGMRIIMASMLIAVIISDALIPEISRMYRDKINVSIKLSSLFDFIVLFSGLTIITIYFYRETIILLLFSRQYLTLDTSIIYILAIILMRYLGIVPGIILTSYGNQIIRARAVFVSIIISILLNFLLIPNYGYEGAFMASVITHIILNVIYFFYSSGIIHFTNGLNILPFAVIYSILTIIQITIFSDNKLFLGVSVFINALIIIIYYIIVSKKNFNLSRT